MKGEIEVIDKIFDEVSMKYMYRITVICENKPSLVLGKCSVKNE